ncbi:hypothetical protein A2803_04715 [Candidatus Woesebacteria bacterium RIFCSPHIGHO2_01_FULL_44_21]|uniref:Uncharacterized protein n=1 Tax=Candidatus Woesebacteria bacterium RIFCSPHIGHO2_01_FULL_44_21 TaxID=1802503 RepID=A0A1F7Z318_9BACT|nr:MAG: hypothetical protein A2803_04715 [Candidatus Woesebacteria bacterium RIFCSPHIGHO2_01_FULL_44_21]OGM69420.1 MAG: hypothetical protein A2897_03645 [Candidatus Woesebacteria bacterium RIFCSPLOWO2_01_FULL_44_24b]
MPERSKGKEHKEIIHIPVEELAKDNPQIETPNPTSYDDMVTSFAPGLFDSIKVARVDFVEQGQMVSRWGIVDGNSKTKFAYDHGKEHGITELECYDATQELLRNPRIADRPGIKKNSLSINEYLRAVIPPTREHRDIAARRIAGHITQGWDGLVGQDISREFTASAALSLLNDPRISTSTEFLLARSISKLDTIISNETEEKRQIIQQALVEMNYILQESQLRPGAVYKEIFILVASKDPMIGGAKQALHQMHGVLNLPAFQSKLDELGQRDIATQKITQDKLANLALETMSRLEKGNQDPSLIPTILLDQNLTLEETSEVISSEQVAIRYDEVRQAKRRKDITQSYSELKGSASISDLELELISRFSEINLKREQFKDVAKVIHKTSTTVNNVTNLLLHIESEQDSLTERGVKQTTLDKVGEVLSDNLQNLAASQSHHQLRLRENELNTAYQESLEAIQRDRVIVKTQAQIDSLIRPRLANSFRPEVTAALEKRTFLYLMAHTGEEINNIVPQLIDLDIDLLVRVVDGSVTLQHAKNLQNGRNSEWPLPTELPRKEIPAEIAEIQNLKLSEALNNLIDVMQFIELNPDYLTVENKEKGWQTIVALVKIVHGHPDAKRMIEDYDSLLKKVIRLQEQLTIKRD